MSESKMREAFETWWPSVGQTIGKVAAWEAWQAATHEALAQPAEVVELTDEELIRAMYNGVITADSTIINDAEGMVQDLKDSEPETLAVVAGLRAVADAAVAADRAQRGERKCKTCNGSGVVVTNDGTKGIYGARTCPDCFAVKPFVRYTEDKLEMVVPDVLFDGYAVFKRAEANCPSLQAHQVGHVLDAVVQLIREAAAINK